MPSIESSYQFEINGLHFYQGLLNHIDQISLSTSSKTTLLQPVDISVELHQFFRLVIEEALKEASMCGNSQPSEGLNRVQIAIDEKGLKFARFFHGENAPHHFYTFYDTTGILCPSAKAISSIAADLLDIHSVQPASTNNEAVKSMKAARYFIANTLLSNGHHPREDVWKTIVDNLIPPSRKDPELAAQIKRDALKARRRKEAQKKETYKFEDAKAAQRKENQHANAVRHLQNRQPLRGL